MGRERAEVRAVWGGVLDAWFINETAKDSGDRPAVLGDSMRDGVFSNMVGPGNLGTA